MDPTDVEMLQSRLLFWGVGIEWNGMEWNGLGCFDRRMNPDNRVSARSVSTLYFDTGREG